MGETRKIALTVNGKRYQEEVEVRLTLADFLRHQLGLTGTHLGCEHGVCGACTILLDGRSARSCLMLAVQSDGHEILTVEGIAPSAEELHPLQQAFHENHGSNSCATIPTRPSRRCASPSPAICAAAPATRTSSSPPSTRQSGCRRKRRTRRKVGRSLDDPIVERWSKTSHVILLALS
jgi:2Fe-2S iron-sulfur cluster protein